MGKDKALLPFEGKPLIARLAERLSALCEETVVSARSEDAYAFLDLPCVRDRFPGRGPLAGLHAGLLAASRPWVFALACDMPFFSEELLRRQWQLAATEDWDVVCPESGGGLEPLHALVHRRAIPAVERVLRSTDFQVSTFFPDVRARILRWMEVRAIDPEGLCFHNWNRPADVPAAGGRKR